uniref:Uncharacterized protein n=1 Tax=Timema cristinae TaxID=61476 RepID=A0A7R9CWR1_TIMCR|nr:unnamed protein product [Timema cristinae]
MTTAPVSLLQLNQQTPATEHQQELNGFIESSPIYVTSIPPEFPSGGDKQQPTTQGKVAAVSNGHAVIGHTGSSTEEADELELKQDLDGDPHLHRPPSEVRGDVAVEDNRVVAAAVSLSASGGVRTAGDGGDRCASPFANGRTEVLIGQEGDINKVRTTAIVENHRGLVVDDEDSLR